MVQHDGVVNFISAMRDELAISAEDCVLALTTLSFDIAGLEIYGGLFSGARLVIAGAVPTATDGASTYRAAGPRARDDAAGDAGNLDDAHERRVGR